MKRVYKMVVMAISAEQRIIMFSNQSDIRKWRGYKALRNID